MVWSYKYCWSKVQHLTGPSPPPVNFQDGIKSHGLKKRREKRRTESGSRGVKDFMAIYLKKDRAETSAGPTVEVESI